MGILQVNMICGAIYLNVVTFSMTQPSNNTNLTLNLDEYICAVSSLASERMHVCYLEESYLEPIIPPLTLIFIGNGCEGYNHNLYIPSKTDLTSEIDTSSRCKFFLGFNVIYQNMTQLDIWNDLKLEKLTLDQKDLLGF